MTDNKDSSNEDEKPRVEWADEQTRRFTKTRTLLKAYKESLEDILWEIVKEVTPEGIVQVRVKSVPGFLEKILRKQSELVSPDFVKLRDPLVFLTDLCAGRIICQTEDQVQHVVRIMEDRFHVDWANSDDARDRLGTAEFGYRTINRIVTFAPNELKRLDLPDLVIPPVQVDDAQKLDEPMPVKMEIQVRTLLAHAWADISHDLVYKTEVRLPPKVRRILAGKAAVLEETDRTLCEFIDLLNQYKSNYGAYKTNEQICDEIELQRIILKRVNKELEDGNLTQHARKENEEEQLAHCLKIARLSLGIGDNAVAIEVLESFADRTDIHDLQLCLGQAYTEVEHHPQSDDLNRGLKHLENAAACSDAGAETFCVLGEAYFQKGDFEKATEAYHKAICCDPTEPRSVCRFVELEVSFHRDRDINNLVEPTVRAAMLRCREQIEAGVNWPVAWSSLSLLHFLNREPQEALQALAQLICLCEFRPEIGPIQYCAAARHVSRLQKAITRLSVVKESLSGYEAMKRFLCLAEAVRGRSQNALDQLSEEISTGNAPPFESGDSVVFVAGGCAPETEELINEVSSHLLRGFRGLPHGERPLVLVGGGTKAGISRLVGDIAETSSGRIRAVGYLPSALPDGREIDYGPQRYAQLIRSRNTNQYSSMEPLQAWTDLVAAGVPLDHIKLLAYAPGPIARVEIAVALALGARVGLIDNPAMPPQRRFDEDQWSTRLDDGDSGFVRLPMDAMSIRAFLLMDELPRQEESLEKAAKRVHENYRKSAKPSDPSLQPWDELAEDLKISNYHQVAYWRDILTTEGLGVRPISKATKNPLDMEKAIGKEGVRRLAEMEHGRWNVERLMLGWRHADTKDVDHKLSPYIVPWETLSAEIQQYDMTAMIELPQTLWEDGLEVFVR